MTQNPLFKFTRKELEHKLNWLESGLSIQQKFAPPNRVTEQDYQKHLFAIIGGKLEYALKGVGRPDILTDYFVIELKNVRSFNRAIGQVICYAYELGGAYIPTVALIGKENIKLNQICSYYQILVMYSDKDTAWYIANKKEFLQGV